MKRRNNSRVLDEFLIFNCRTFDTEYIFLIVILYIYVQHRSEEISILIISSKKNFKRFLNLIRSYLNVERYNVKLLKFYHIKVNN